MIKRGWVVFLAAFFVADVRPAAVLDPVFNQGPGTDTFAENVQILPNGQILLCGAFSKYNGEPAPYVARINSDGTRDRSFQSAAGGWVRNMVVQPDGKVVIGGAFISAGGHSRNLIARLNADGSLDPTFDPGLGFQDKLTPGDPNPAYVFWMALQPDGKIIVTGSFAKYNGRSAKGIVRLNANGSVDESFRAGSGIDSWGRFVRVLPNGQILLSGWFTSYNGYGCNRLLRLNADGTPDSTFRPFFGDKTAIYCAVPLADGKTMVSGHSKNEQNLFKRGLARLNPNGTEDPAFVGTTNERTESLLLQPDGKILACGWFTLANGQYRGMLARFNSDGSLDTGFAPYADYFIWTMARDAQGGILVAGGFKNILGQARLGIARLIDSDMPMAPRVTSAKLTNGRFEAAVATESNRSYCLEYCETIGGGWRALPAITGTGSNTTLTDSQAAGRKRIYRVRMQ